MAKGAKFYLDNQKFFTDTTATIITSKNDELKYILGCLNSTLIYFVMRNFYMGGGIEGEFKTNNLEKIPIPKINSANKNLANEIINLVSQTLQSKAENSSTDIDKFKKSLTI